MTEYELTEDGTEGTVDPAPLPERETGSAPLPGLTPNGWPYVTPDDHPKEYPAVSQALANALDLLAVEKVGTAGLSRPARWTQHIRHPGTIQGPAGIVTVPYIGRIDTSQPFAVQITLEVAFAWSARLVSVGEFSLQLAVFNPADLSPIPDGAGVVVYASIMAAAY